MTQQSRTTIAQQEEEFQGKFFEAILGAQLAQTAFLGLKLGWYQALADAGDEGLLPTELASRTQSSARYAREWLEQQAVAGWIHCRNDQESDPNQRRFVLPASHTNVLVGTDSPLYLAPLAILHGGTGKVMDQLVDAYKNDTGVSWDDIGNDAREAQAAMNRPFFQHSLPGILDSILGPDELETLKHGQGRIADIGGGYAHSSIVMAQHFPSAHIDVYDLDEPSIRAATANIAAAGLSHRIVAKCANAATALDVPDFTPWNLVVAYECIHDMGDPISVLRTMRQMAGATGTVLVMDEPVADAFASSQQHGDNSNPVELAAYGFSCLCCLADGKSYGPDSVATGAVMRPSLLRMYAQQAGFRDIVKCAIDSDTFHFYKLLF